MGKERSALSTTEGFVEPGCSEGALVVVRAKRTVVVTPMYVFSIYPGQVCPIDPGVRPQPLLDIPIPVGITTNTSCYGSSSTNAQLKSELPLVRLFLASFLAAASLALPLPATNPSPPLPSQGKRITSRQASTSVVCEPRNHD